MGAVAARRPVSGPAAAPLAGGPCCSWLTLVSGALCTLYGRALLRLPPRARAGRLSWSPPGGSRGTGRFGAGSDGLPACQRCTVPHVWLRLRPRPPPGLFSSALRTLAVRRTSHLLRLIHRACDLALSRNRCVASYICCLAAREKTRRSQSPCRRCSLHRSRKKQHTPQATARTHNAAAAS